MQLIKKKGKHRQYSVKMPLDKYSAWCLKRIRKLEFGDGEINWCTGSTSRPHLYLLSLLKFHIVKKQDMNFPIFYLFIYLFIFCVGEGVAVSSSETQLHTGFSICFHDKGYWKVCGERFCLRVLRLGREAGKPFDKKKCWLLFDTVIFNY